MGYLRLPYNFSSRSSSVDLGTLIIYISFLNANRASLALRRNVDIVRLTGSLLTQVLAGGEAEEWGRADKERAASPCVLHMRKRRPLAALPARPCPERSGQEHFFLCAHFNDMCRPVNWVWLSGTSVCLHLHGCRRFPLLSSVHSTLKCPGSKSRFVLLCQV